MGGDMMSAEILLLSLKDWPPMCWWASVQLFPSKDPERVLQTLAKIDILLLFKMKNNNNIGHYLAPRVYELNLPKEWMFKSISSILLFPYLISASSRLLLACIDRAGIDPNDLNLEDDLMSSSTLFALQLNGKL